MADWLVVTSEDNLARVLEHQIIGVPAHSSSTLSKIKKGDRIVIYVGKKKQGYGGPNASVSEFAAIGEVLDDKPFFDEKRIWHSRSAEKFPWRRKAKIISNKHIKAKELIGKLNFITKKQKWGAYFLTTLRQISDVDYKLISAAMGVKSR